MRLHVSNSTGMECTQDMEYEAEIESHQRSMCLQLPIFAGMQDPNHSENSTIQPAPWPLRCPPVPLDSVSYGTLSSDESAETSASREDHKSPLQEFVPTLGHTGPEQAFPIPYPPLSQAEQEEDEARLDTLDSPGRVFKKRKDPERQLLSQDRLSDTCFHDMFNEEARNEAHKARTDTLLSEEDETLWHELFNPNCTAPAQTESQPTPDPPISDPWPTVDTVLNKPPFSNVLIPKIEFDKVAVNDCVRHMGTLYYIFKTHDEKMYQLTDICVQRIGQLSDAVQVYWQCMTSVGATAHMMHRTITQPNWSDIIAFAEARVADIQDRVDIQQSKRVAREKWQQIADTQRQMTWDNGYKQQTKKSKSGRMGPHLSASREAPIATGTTSVKITHTVDAIMKREQYGAQQLINTGLQNDTAVSLLPSVADCDTFVTIANASRTEMRTAARQLKIPWSGHKMLEALLSLPGCTFLESEQHHDLQRFIAKEWSFNKARKTLSHPKAGFATYMSSQSSRLSSKAPQLDSEKWDLLHQGLSHIMTEADEFPRHKYVMRPDGQVRTHLTKFMKKFSDDELMHFLQLDIEDQVQKLPRHRSCRAFTLWHSLTNRLSECVRRSIYGGPLGYNGLNVLCEHVPELEAHRSRTHAKLMHMRNRHIGTTLCKEISIQKKHWKKEMVLGYTKEGFDK